MSMRSKDLKALEPTIIKCYHCGNETPMKKVGTYTWGSRDYEYSDFDYLYTYELFACPVCHKVTLRQTYSDEDMVRFCSADYEDYVLFDEKTVLYPVSSIEHNSVPQKIKDAYEAALKTRGVDKYLCLMGLRRTLELILKDKGAKKWGLKDKIEEIAAKGLLPDTLKEASSLAKMFGDAAAHDKEIDVDQHDVDAMSDFIGYIIEYLYVVPDRINTYKLRLDEKSNNNT